MTKWNLIIASNFISFHLSTHQCRHELPCLFKSREELVTYASVNNAASDECLLLSLTSAPNLAVSNNSLLLPILRWVLSCSSSGEWTLNVALNHTLWLSLACSKTLHYCVARTASGKRLCSLSFGADHFPKPQLDCGPCEECFLSCRKEIENISHTVQYFSHGPTYLTRSNISHTVQYFSHGPTYLTRSNISHTVQHISHGPIYLTRSNIFHTVQHISHYLTYLTQFHYTFKIILLILNFSPGQYLQLPTWNN